jgi:hypothetical protein
VSIHDEIAADFSEILQDFGKVVFYQGQPLLALISEPMLASELVLGGEVDDVRFTMKTLRTSVPALPHTGQIIRWEDKDYRIRAVMSRPPHAIVAFEVGPADP